MLQCSTRSLKFTLLLSFRLAILKERGKELVRVSDEDTTSGPIKLIQVRATGLRAGRLALELVFTLLSPMQLRDTQLEISRIPVQTSGPCVLLLLSLLLQRPKRGAPPFGVL